MKWKYEPKPDAQAQGMACCQPINRGPMAPLAWALHHQAGAYLNFADCHRGDGAALALIGVALRDSSASVAAGGHAIPSTARMNDAA